MPHHVRASNPVYTVHIGSAKTQIKLLSLFLADLHKLAFASFFVPLQPVPMTVLALSCSTGLMHAATNEHTSRTDFPIIESVFLHVMLFRRLCNLAAVAQPVGLSLLQRMIPRSTC